MTTWERIEQRRLLYYTKYARLFQKALTEQIKPLFTFLEQQTYIDNIENIIPTLITPVPLRTSYQDMYATIGLDFRRNIHESIRKQGFQQYIKKNLDEDFWMDEMRAYADLFVGERITWMTATTRDFVLGEVKDVIKEASEQGLGVDSIAKMIRDRLKEKFPISARDRAKTIAQTETLTASNYASFRSAADTGLPMRKIWLTAPWGVSKTERHNLIQGLGDQRPMMEEDFIVDNVQMKYPGDPRGGAAHVINCKCAIAYEVLGE